MNIRKIVRDFFVEFTINRNNKVKDCPIIRWVYIISSIFVFIGILMWVLIWNKWYITITEKNFGSTVIMKVNEGFSTNFTDDHFDDRYVKQYEHINYNRQWDNTDYTFEFSDEIQVMTNVVITANQSFSTCPEHPHIFHAPCNPKNNKCVKGNMTLHGVQTGKCVPADFPYQDKHGDYINVTTCQIKGWCPVDRLFPPLKNYTAVLSKTKNITLWLENTITFSNYNIRIDNQMGNKSHILNCQYHRQSNPSCPIFVLKDIIESTTNDGNLTYDEMEKFGGVIVISINWDCHIDGWIFKNHNSLYDCNPRYTFTRTEYYTISFYKSYEFAHYFNNDQSRTHYRSFRIRFLTNVNVKVRENNIFLAITYLLAYNSVYQIPGWIIMFYVKQRYTGNWDKIINLNDLTNQAGDAVNYENHSNNEDTAINEHNENSHNNDDSDTCNDEEDDIESDRFLR